MRMKTFFKSTEKSPCSSEEKQDSIMKDLSPHKIIHCLIPTLSAYLIIFFTP